MAKIRYIAVVCLMGIILSFAGPGCQNRSSETKVKKISMEQYWKLSADERDDPYVLQHLDTSPKGQ